MDKLYIANCTKVKREFMFTLPERTSPVRIPIPIGHQMMVFEGGSDAIDYIIKQHRKYGLVNSDEACKSRDFVGLCYSINKPVQADQLSHMIDKNYQILDDKMQEGRVNSALVINHQVNEMMKEARVPGQLRELSVSITEEPNPNSTDQKKLGREKIDVTTSIPERQGIKKSKTIEAR